MRKIAVVFLGLVCIFPLAGISSAQVPSGNVFFGYSYYSTNLSSLNRTNANGWEASLEGKFLPIIGIVADFDSHYGSQDFPASCPVQIPNCSLSFTANFTEHNYLFGPRASFSVGKIRPFAEVLIGAGHVHINNGGSDTSFATAVGGGLDYKFLKLLAWRIQGHYVHTNLFDTSQHNVRISTGIVVRF
ncbi:MAG TPA: outer membrane beta-barrel protein [Candidatus Eisenbacteria bacterium]|nr:outer membrane beta-barrel protein [Candidatus Eisenbacteria bacterium]